MSIITGTVVAPLHYRLWLHSGVAHCPFAAYASCSDLIHSDSSRLSQRMAPSSQEQLICDARNVVFVRHRIMLWPPEYMGRRHRSQSLFRAQNPAQIAMRVICAIALFMFYLLYKEHRKLFYSQQHLYTPTHVNVSARTSASTPTLVTA